MRRWLSIAVVVLVYGALCASAQDTPAPAPASTPPASAPRKTQKKSAAPDSVPDAPAPAADAAPASPTPQADTAPAPAEITSAPAGKKRSAADANPFPEDFSKAADKNGGDTAPPDPSQADAPTQDSNSQGSAQPGSGATPDAAGPPESSSQQGLDKLDLYGDKGKKKNKKDADPDAGLPFDPKLAAQDDKIGELYLKNGNAPGAYSRFKEASQYDAGNADAVFGLAEAAKQMNLLDEAAQAYQTYLFAFPDGPKARLAKKSLAELKIKNHP